MTTADERPCTLTVVWRQHLREQQLRETDSLRAVCVLAYDLLRQPDCPIEVPASMQPFVHQPQLSPRALTVAYEALEREPQLRAHVANHANDSGIDLQDLAPIATSELPERRQPVIDLVEVEALHRRIAELEAQVAALEEQATSTVAELEERTNELASRTEQWRQALRDLSAAST